MGTDLKFTHRYLKYMKNVDLVLGIKNVFELEGIINSRDCFFKFLNRSVPIYPENAVVLKPNEQKLVKSQSPIIKILDGSTYSTLLIKLKVTHNKAVLHIVNKGKDTMIFKPGEMIFYYRFKIFGVL